MRKDLRELLKQLPGWEAAPTKGQHVKLVHTATGAKVFCASTPSDHRAVKNTLAFCKRAEVSHD